MRHSSKIRQARPLTASDLASGRYTIRDVVLPLPGFSIVYPAGPLGDLYRDIIRSDKIDPDDMFRKQKEYSLGGAYRHVMHMPSEVAHQLLVYDNLHHDMAISDEDVLLGKTLPPQRAFDPDVPLADGEMLALKLEMTLGSSTYATMALREVLKARTSGAHQRSLTETMQREDLARKAAPDAASQGDEAVDIEPVMTE